MNAATRLYSLLVALKRDNGKNRPLRNAVAELFGLKSPTAPDLMRNYVNMLTLTLEVETKLRSIPSIQHDLYCRGIRELQNCLATSSLDSDLYAFRDRLKAEHLTGLEFAAALLDAVEAEKEIPQKDLAELSKKLGKLVDEVNAADLDAEFKSFLVTKLAAVGAAINNYRFFGAAGIRSAMAVVVGELVLDPPVMKGEAKSKSFLRRALDTFKDINAVVTFARHGADAVTALHINEMLQLNG